MNLGVETMPFESAAGIHAATTTATAAAAGKVQNLMPPKPVTIVNAMTKEVTKVVPMAMDRAVVSTTAASSSGGFLTGLKNVALAPFRSIRNLFSSKPTASAAAGTVSAAAKATTAGATVAATDAAAKVTTAGSTSTAAATSSKSGIRAMIDEVLPKAEPVSGKLLGKRVLASMAFGIIGNGIKSGYYIATGKWSGGQAWQFMLRDTVKGAVGGAAFGLGLGLTTMALQPLGVAGIPLIIASMAGGSVLSLGSLQLLAQYDGWDWGYI